MSDITPEEFHHLLILSEQYLLNDGWELASSALVQDIASVDESVAQDYSFLAKFQDDSTELDEKFVEQKISVKNDAKPTIQTPNGWSDLIDYIRKIGYDTPHDEYRLRPKVMMIVSYAQGKFAEVKAYAQKWMQAIGLGLEDVYYTTVYKTTHAQHDICLSEEEVAIIKQEIALIAPQYLILGGRLAYEALFSARPSVSKARMRLHTYEGIATMVTYDPQFVLQYPVLREDVWADLKRLQAYMGRKRETHGK
ncbi:uracil-DNA glycosylase family protein [Entomospira culicis]|uniref:Uracil-DNA glycosylase-like domain-containing protein n=1 Tax=Entomospira culicis TaxID=2719989 RepID=A0A968GGL5_9SPIO|nr:uracil-DNA glycosylase family protein [Entomospira culicis]NIZ19728.1 hypothetical protein [Entomospira culicis]NIZ69942.1 hypothetical protein [Entomospira culicis]WDI37047.1 uracil-DNA glycosylase family protein [Entomospira culicis]WDI38676.1 uracil-DNA glycosylase family protein [Entomospira culicis]